MASWASTAATPWKEFFHSGGFLTGFPSDIPPERPPRDNRRRCPSRPTDPSKPLDGDQSQGRGNALTDPPKADVPAEPLRTPHESTPAACLVGHTGGKSHECATQNSRWAGLNSAAFRSSPFERGLTTRIGVPENRNPSRNRREFRKTTPRGGRARNPLGN